jgi:hypothetical protein
MAKAVVPEKAFDMSGKEMSKKLRVKGREESKAMPDSVAGAIIRG